MHLRPSDCRQQPHRSVSSLSTDAALSFRSPEPSRNQELERKTRGLPPPKETPGASDGGAEVWRQQRPPLVELAEPMPSHHPSPSSLVSVLLPPQELLPLGRGVGGVELWGQPLNPNTVNPD